MGLDLSKALERVGGDEELLKEIAELFLEDAPRLLDDIRAAVASGDATALQKSAHALKGSVANFGAAEAVAAAFKLEQMGREGILGGAAEGLSALEAEIGKVSEGLAQL